MEKITIGEKAIRSITILSNKLRRQLDSRFGSAECSGSQGRILSFLLANRKQELFQRNIEEEFGMRSASATQALRKMEDQGLIQRESVSYDARLTSTPSGAASVAASICSSVPSL